MHYIPLAAEMEGQAPQLVWRGRPRPRTVCSEINPEFLC